MTTEPVHQPPTYQSTWDALIETMRLLWPTPATIGVAPDPHDQGHGDQGHGEGERARTAAGVPGGHRVVREFLVLPDRRHPRVALPVSTARVTAEALRKHSQALSLGERAVRTALSGLVRLPGVHPGLARVAPHRIRVSVPQGRSAESFEDHLAGILGHEVVVAIGVGQPRANRKPVLHALTPEGDTVAYVKVGTKEPTKVLVRDEAAALGSFWSADRPTTTLRVPRVLHHGRWRGLEVLVLAPLRPESGHWRRRTVPLSAMRELAGHFGTTESTLAQSPVWGLAQDTPDALRDADRARRFDRILAEAGARHGDTKLMLGAWHGDWTPWNMAWSGDHVLLWDFERFATGVPFGYDLTHYRLQATLRDAGEEGAGRHVRRQLATDPAHRVPTDDIVFSGNDPEAVWIAYLVELARRYTLASEPAEGAPLRARTTWLLDLLDDLVLRR
ncbi:hypothetical protein [Actinopolymorpha sp. B9G3]|uniref:hypothetical protein n=1 Tax=Actinopolymorpha sp. B9G3 TaxID=3158970 RepID=UPI0032D989E7